MSLSRFSILPTRPRKTFIGLIGKMIGVYDEAFVILDVVDEIGQDRAIVSGSSQKPS